MCVYVKIGIIEQLGSRRKREFCVQKRKKKNVLHTHRFENIHNTINTKKAASVNWVVCAAASQQLYQITPTNINTTTVTTMHTEKRGREKEIEEEKKIKQSMK